jgi:formamidopyrimidine-DNA glycosylase
MPELPEVETIVRGLRPRLCGRTIKSIQLLGRPSFRGEVPLFLTSIKNQPVLSVLRHGKTILLNMPGNTLSIHLGMTGQLLWSHTNHPVEPHTHVLFSLSSIDDQSYQQLRYRDIRRFGRLKLLDKQKTSNRVPDAWECSIDEMFAALRPRNARLKHALLSQKYIAGLGNIYVDESLFSAGLHPASSISHVGDKRLRRLCEEIKQVLKTSINLGGTSFRNYVDVHGGRGGFKGLLSIYGKAGRPCPRCGATIEKIFLAGRGTHFCSHCQRMSSLPRRTDIGNNLGKVKGK